MKHLMRVTVIILGVAAVALFAGVLLSANAPDIYKSPLILIPAVALVLIQIICLVLGKSRKIGFYALHIAVCVIAVSAFASMFTYKDISFNIPVNDMWYDSVAKSDGGEVNFGFAVSANDLRIEYEDPDYTVYRYNGGIGAYELLAGNVSCRGGVYRIGNGYSDIKRDMLVTSDGFVETYKTADGSLMLKRGKQTVKTYGVMLSVKAADKTYSEKLAVNSPVFAEGWKFYFMDCDTESRSYVSLYAKKDPANIPIRIGICLLLAGTVALCLENLLRGRKNNGNS